MINEIKNKFVAILDDMDEQRAAADLSFRHEIKLHTREIYNVWLRQIRRVERKHGVNLGLTDAAVKKALRPCINKVFKRTNIHQILRRQVAYGLDKPGDAGYLTIHASGDPLTIVLVSGRYYQKRTKGTQAGIAHGPPYNQVAQQKVISYLFQELFYQMGDEINATSAFSGIAQSSSSKLLGDHRAYGTVMAHGDYQPTPGVDQPTVANIALKKGAMGAEEDIRADLQETYFADITSAVPDKDTKMLAEAATQMVDTYVDSLERDYKIRDNIDYDELSLKRQFVVRGHYTDRTGNKDKDMQFYDKGRFSANGTGILGQMYKLDQQLRKEFLDEAKKDTEEYAKLEGSPSYRKAQERLARKVAILGLVGAAQQTAKKNPDLRLRVNKKLLKEAEDVKRKSRKKTNVKRSAGSRKSSSKKYAAKAIAVGKGVAAQRGRGKVDSAAGNNPLALKNLLNEVLPQEVAKRMQSPALNYRTGRFANSAEVTEVMMGPRGGLQSIDYTYQRNPYETFEPGGKQGSIQRDPRKLIGGTIRELAQGIIGRKMIPTRRV